MIQFDSAYEFNSGSLMRFSIGWIGDGQEGP